MKSKKLKPVTPRSSKKKVSSDVSPSTSLPPLVEGQLRCFLCVTISQIIWTVQKAFSPTFIRLRWWGESSDGTHFIPRDGSQLSQKNIKTTARFPVRCGPKQLTSYLTDMGALMLEVLTKSDHLPVARAQVAGISRLSLSQPISGFYPLVSPTSEKLGELQVRRYLNEKLLSLVPHAVDLLFHKSLQNENCFSNLLLQAQFPVLGVDCYMPVIDVFSGRCKGNLRVVLAMGRSEQIVSLQRARDEENGSLSHLTRPVHLLDLQPQSHSKVRVSSISCLQALQ
uniref:C2CD3 N-terminal C2 domain-containing protein n=1 Tax=Oryzias latipes TaxID=8090 RepID=A0A3B3HP40_ORYLA